MIFCANTNNGCIMKDTLSSIAERLGISMTTVSRVANGKADLHRISKDTQQIVLAELRRCGYIDEKSLEHLHVKKTHTIGLVVPSVSNPYFADIATSVIREAEDHGYTTMVLDSREDIECQKNCLDTLISRKVEGLVIAPCGEDPGFIERINQEIAPVVFIDRYFDGCKIPYVTSNNFQGGLDGTNILISHGHKNIVCIQGDISSLPNRRRVAGYLQALKKAGLTDKAKVVGDAFSVSNGYMETKLLLTKAERPTAIFTLSNTIALGAIKAIREASLRIPEDISLVSFDNNLYLDYITPPITRISQPIAEMGKLASKILFEKIKSSGAIPQLELSIEIIMRNSVAIL